ncbi:DUF6979 family protein [Lutibacter maritimus]|uniref:Uncharacterized protein n=1 Tax=Lutibacter maritimus TaxID=593133 RepID=A0A1I6SQK4_9FLAO|nr:hypothetical protein [Lutibacter maritimus]SFS79196.1 hypothetical protein SAMN04488006_0053 [Lutibacter maritimus]
MNKYGKAAIKSVDLINLGKTPAEAWEIATLEIFGESTSAIKSCPKSTFLGLCEDGLVKGISKGKYTKSAKNKAYALKAVQVLKKSNLEIQPTALWNEIQNKNIQHNSQMHVVLALWNNDLIV